MFSYERQTMSDWTLDALAIGPHPDDVELCCGGIVATLSARGYRVGVLDLTRGELASNGTVEQRAEEAAAAATILGLAERHNLGLPDGGIDPRSESQVRALVDVLRTLRPEIVLSPPLAARHPDHEAAGELVGRALFFAGLARYGDGARYQPRRVMRYEMRVALRPTLIVDTSATWDTKVAAIACYGSQIRRDGATPTLVNAPETLTAIEARDRRYGAMIGAATGEPLELTSPLGSADPLDTVRAEPGGPIHLFEERS